MCEEGRSEIEAGDAVQSDEWECRWSPKATGAVLASSEKGPQLGAALKP